jgi:DMSO/TMAO reductase YedYZ molybdopterin-dependent catalytic subunit
MSTRGERRGVPEDDPGDDARAAFERRLRERSPGLAAVPARSGTLAAGPASRATYAAGITPIEEFYVLNHYPTPAIDADSWTVSLTGDVDAVDLSVRELRDAYPTETVTHTMECAGNGRAGFASVDDEPARYVQWGHEGVGTARWTGTPLSAVLERNGAATEGRWLTAIGGDAPDEEADVFARSLPMEKVLDDCLLADRMNGEPLPPEHGHPVRVVVPGWYGVNSVKWVARLHVADRMIAGEEWARYTRWQQRSYRLAFGDEEPAERETLAEVDTWAQLAGEEVANPYCYDQHVTSLVAVPGDGETVAPGPDGSVDVVGVAWAGDDRVASVEVSADGGETWHEATFPAPDPGPTVWRRFRCHLELPPGDHRVVSRATDDRGRRQPARTSEPGAGRAALDDDAYPWNREGYGNNAYRDYGTTFTVAGERD